jgi:hypothetical protein
MPGFIGLDNENRQMSIAFGGLIICGVYIVVNLMTLNKRVLYLYIRKAGVEMC